MTPRLAQLLPRLDIRPNHHLLEIGCGTGTAVAAVAELLTGGSILGIDRSAGPVALARSRNADHIARGVARIEQTDLTRLRLPAQHFHTVFAVNVNLFPDTDPHLVAVIRRALRRRGRLVLGYERPSPRHLEVRAAQISATLEAGGLSAPTVDWAGPTRLFLTAIRI